MNKSTEVREKIQTAVSEPLSILVVEDNDTDFSLLQRALNRQAVQCSIQRATTHLELTKVLAREEFDAFVVDMGLPDASGAVSIYSIRSSDDSVPIIALTGGSGSDPAVLALRAGANSFFEKSVPTYGLIADRIAKAAAVAKGDRSRFRTLAELDEVKNRFQDYAEAASDWFWEKDDSLRYTYVSSGVERVTGLTPGEIVGRTIWEVFSGSDPTANFGHERDVRDHRRFREYMCEIRRKDGTTRTVMISGKTVFNESGRFIGYRGVGRDVTEEMLNQKKLAQALEAAEAANRSQSQFLAVMSHELRTPLNAIIGFSDVLYAGTFHGDPERAHEYMGHISQAGRQLLNLVNDILDLSQLKAGGRTLNIEDIEVTSVIAECIQFVSNTAELNGIKIDNRCAMKSIIAQADDRALHQIVQNILINAVKFSNKGDVILVECELLDEFVSITVTDSGIGMDEDALGRVTEAFFQAESATSRRNGGAGLGLAIINELIKRHKGQLHLRSKLGEGTTVEVVIPARVR